MNVVVDQESIFAFLFVAIRAFAERLHSAIPVIAPNLDQFANGVAGIGRWIMSESAGNEASEELRNLMHLEPMVSSVAGSVAPDHVIEICICELLVPQRLRHSASPGV